MEAISAGGAGGIRVIPRQGVGPAWAGPTPEPSGVEVGTGRAHVGVWEDRWGRREGTGEVED